MTNIRSYGQEAEIACKNEPGLQVKMAELKKKFYHPNSDNLIFNSCEEGDLMAITTDIDGIGRRSLKEGIADNYYTCAPFVHQTHVITKLDYMDAEESNLCPEGYTQTLINILKSGHTVVTCMGVISDATSGELIYGTCSLPSSEL